MSFRENYEMAKESIRSGDMQKYISGKYKGIKGKVRGAKDFAKSSAGKKMIKHIILWRVLPIVLPLVILVTTIIIIQNSIRSQVDSVLQAAMNWVTIDSNDDDEGYLHESYVVTPDAGIPGCILRPQTGIYADSKIASGVGIYKADFPSGLKSLEQVLQDPAVVATIQKDVNNGKTEGMSYEKYVEQRGLFKSFMGLQTMSTGKYAEMGQSNSNPVLWGIKNKRHDLDKATGKVDTKDYTEFFDDKGFFRVANRYGIAIKPGYATLMGYERQFKPGDYIDAYLDSGDVIQCIVIDEKQQGAGADDGAGTENYVMHNDGSILEFIVDKDSWYGVGIAPNTVIPEFNQKIKGIALAGSWEEDTEGTGASCTKYKASDEYKSEEVVIDLGSYSKSDNINSGTYNGVFPSDKVSIAQILETEKSKGLISDSTRGVADRGKAKSMMGWQTLGTAHSGGNITHADHSAWDEYIGIDTRGKGNNTEQWIFLNAVHNGTHNHDEASKLKMKRGDIDKFNNTGFAFVDGRYVVAIKEDFGEYVWGEKTKIGDAIDIYLDNGTVISAWVGDFKAHENASNCVHSDGSIVEFITDVRKFYGCCNGNGSGNNINPSSVNPEFGESITGILKVGNWFENNGEVTGPSGSSEVSGESGGMAYLDENGQPCDPNGEVNCSGTDSWEQNFGATPGRRTLKNLMANAFSCMGRVTYMWGGGQGSGPGNVIGIQDQWVEFYKKNHDENKENKIKSTSKGLDCCGFVKYAIYNTFFTENNQDYSSIAGGWGLAADFGGDLVSGGTYANLGKQEWGSYDAQPGDIISSSGHIMLVVGKSENGGTVIIHAPQTGELIHLAGTSGTGAVSTAEKYNNIINSVSSGIMGNTPVEWFPAGRGQGSGTFNRGADNKDQTTYNTYRPVIGENGLEDPDGIANMSAEQVLELIIGDGMGTGGDCQNNANGNGTTIFLDPGHGPNIGGQSDETKRAWGYVQKSSGEWGEWRHFGPDGKIGDGCKGYDPDPTNDSSNKKACWYPTGNSERNTEPEICYGICEKLKPILEGMGYKVVMSRTSSEHPSITKRAKDAYEAGADIQICVHSNAGGGRGVAWCSPDGGSKISKNSYKQGDWYDKSVKLNKALYNGVLNSGSGLGAYGDGTIDSYGHLILYERATCPTAYLEIGFYDNKSELAILQSADGQQKIAQGIANGVKEYYGK